MDYFMQSKYKNELNEPSSYNDKTKVLSEMEAGKLLGFDADFDPFKVSVKNGGPVPDE